MVDLCGYPGDEWSDWVSLYNECKPALNDEECRQVERWLSCWNGTLQRSLMDLRQFEFESRDQYKAILDSVRSER